ncbi:hypothetical protein CD110_05340 [Staphylococcus casei]|uniref:sirohydrochlorin chelatase n=1 Tax=Staphylococcus TaxID=1279 RepID=UPI000CD2EAA7|nr:sirohydrochlorin chelatase [Staphylococcus casei]PNZ60182.1 hypothetical protein CD110_05340 [Staphylococcus casei]WJE86895.1 sirohydrochlorin chelatase [Staphylococcus casei]
MTTNIIVIHGMRAGEQNKILKKFVQYLLNKETFNYHIAFLESELQSLEVIITSLMREGIYQFHIVPLLLFPAKHYLYDIPCILKRIKAVYPELVFNIAQPLGTHTLMSNLIRNKLDEAINDDAMIDAVILMAHGSTQYHQPNLILKRLVKTCHINDKPVYMMTLYGEFSYQAMLSKCAKQHKKILIIPVFLYDGYILKKMKQSIETMNLSALIIYSSAINFSPILASIIRDRVNQLEVLKNVSHST